jgi:L-threonylcarbamoyladenylate synthase
MLKNVEKCVEVLRAGGLILYPTDTVWGIGCDATNEEAVAKVYALKQSQEKTSMLCLMRDADMIVRYVNKAPGIAFEVMELSDKPLTAILPGAVGVAKNLIPDAETLGVRIPQHEFCQALLRKFGKPIVSTSANISGEPTAKRLKDVDEVIIKGVDYVVHPRFEGKPTLKPSSIIAFGEGSEVEVIRN